MPSLNLWKKLLKVLQTNFLAKNLHEQWKKWKKSTFPVLLGKHFLGEFLKNFFDRFDLSIPTLRFLIRFLRFKKIFVLLPLLTLKINESKIAKKRLLKRVAETRNCDHQREGRYHQLVDIIALYSTASVWTLLYNIRVMEVFCMYSWHISMTFTLYSVHLGHT
jgi:hypothetical protein